MGIEQRLHARCGCAASAGGGARPFAFAGTPRVFERDRPFRVTHLELDLELDVERKSIGGSAALDVTRIDAAATELVLDAIAFDVERVEVDGKLVTHVYDGRELRVPVPEGRAAARVLVTYRATPRKGLYFLAPDEHVKGRPRQVWSQCQEEDARYWFPCQDKPHVKMTTALAVRVPRGWFALSNGVLADRETPEGGASWRYRWKMERPHASYLVTLVAGEFASYEEEGPGGVPLTYLFPQGREEDARRAFGGTPKMIELFARLTGAPYPWNKYAQVVVSDFIFGGMENTTATTMYEHILLDARAAIDMTSDDLVAHELAHQWFGDFVTCRDWSEAWLNEGFATYMEHVWREESLGPDDYAYGVKGDLETYVAEAQGRYRRPVVCQEYDAPLDLFDRHLYEKGGLVLHALRVELGRDVFWRGVAAYLAAHAHGVVETRDLQRALETASGRSLGRFFEQWLYKSGHPEAEVTLTWEREALTVIVKQHHAHTDGVPSAFEFPLWLDMVDAEGGTRRERLHVSQRTETFALRAPARPAFVVVDPEQGVVGDLRVRAPVDMLRRQLEAGQTARARWLAAQALASGDDVTSIAALAARLADDAEFWGVRVECADALAKIRADEAFSALAARTEVAHPKVRRAVMAALGAFRTTAAALALRPHVLTDPSYLVEAEAARALGKTRREGAFDVLVDVLDRPSWADVIRGAAADGLAALRDERATPHLVARTRYGHPERARRAAIMALPKLASDRRTRELLEDLLDDGNPHVRIDAIRALAELADGRSRGALRARLDVDLDARVRRRLREALRDLSADRGGTRELRDELEKTTHELGELKARLAKLEARTEGQPAVTPPATGARADARSADGPSARPQGIGPSRSVPLPAKKRKKRTAPG